MESFNVRPQTHKRLKERVSIGRSRAKSAHFRGSPLFQATHNIKQQQTNKQLIQLILCQLDVGGWQKEKGMRLTGQLVLCPFPSASLPLKQPVLF